MYNVSLKYSAEKDLNKINEPYFSSLIKEIGNLEKNPRNEKVRKLKGKKNEYRLKDGNYRILFYIIENEKAVKIARILHRKDRRLRP